MSTVRVTVWKDGDVARWEGRAALVVVLREDQGQPLPVISIRGGSTTDLVFALSALLGHVEREVHPGAVDAAVRFRHDLLQLPTLRRESGGGAS